MATVLLGKHLCLSYCLIIGVVLALDESLNELDSHQTHPINPKSPASRLFDEVDLLKLINISTKDHGISLVDGPIHKYPAYKFRLPYGNVAIKNSTILITTINNPMGFTIVFLYRQQKNNFGTLISINSPGRLTPWLQLTTNSKTGILTLKYRTTLTMKLQQIDWLLPKHYKKSSLAAWTWLSLSFDIINDIIRLDLDCQPSRFESLNIINNDNKTHIIIPKDSLVYFRQEPGRKKKFLGSIQVAKLLPYVSQDRLWTCMEISSNLTPQFRKPIV